MILISLVPNVVIVILLLTKWWIKHYYRNDFARHPFGPFRGGHIFLPVTVNHRIFQGGHFSFTEADISAYHGKSIYRDGRPKTSATENALFFGRAY